MAMSRSRCENVTIKALLILRNTSISNKGGRSAFGIAVFAFAKTRTSFRIRPIQSHEVCRDARTCAPRFAFVRGPRGRWPGLRARRKPFTHGQRFESRQKPDGKTLTKAQEHENYQNCKTRSNRRPRCANHGTDAIVWPDKFKLHRRKCKCRRRDSPVLEQHRKGDLGD
jgi:hypothetical protein